MKAERIYLVLHTRPVLLYLCLINDGAESVVCFITEFRADPIIHDMSTRTEKSNDSLPLVELLPHPSGPQTSAHTSSTSSRLLP